MKDTEKSPLGSPENQKDQLDNGGKNNPENPKSLGNPASKSSTNKEEENDKRINKRT